MDMQRRPTAVINVFTLKPGRQDEFFAVQEAAAREFAGSIPGLRGGRMHRSLDGKTAALISLFDSQEDLQRWLDSARFAAHREKILGLVERADAGRYEMVYETGSLDLS